MASVPQRVVNVTIYLYILLLAFQNTLTPQLKRSSEDDALVERARKLDDEAWQAIFEKHYPRLYKYLYYRVGDPDIAEDLCGEVFEKAIKNIHRFKSRDGGLAAWLTRIAQNVGHDYHRRRKARPPQPLTLNEAWVDVGEDPSRQLFADESVSYLQRALKKLTPEQQEVILLRFIAQMRTSDVAMHLGKTPGAIKAMQHRALLSLRRELEKLGYHV